MKQRIARVSLVVACILFFTGFFVMGAGQGWYASAAAFALVPVFLGSSPIRRVGISLAIFSSILITAHILTMRAEKEHLRNIKKRLEQRQGQPTNQVVPPAPADKDPA